MLPRIDDYLSPVPITYDDKFGELLDSLPTSSGTTYPRPDDDSFNVESALEEAY